VTTRPTQATLSIKKELGTGFLEAAYQEALERGLRNKNIPFVSQSELAIHYKGIQIESGLQTGLDLLLKNRNYLLPTCQNDRDVRKQVT